MLRRFLYFLPGLGGINPKMLSDRGLVSRFPAEYGVTGSIDGPFADGEICRGGCLVAASNRPARYEPDRQQWMRLANGAAWVGIEDTELPPGPADLERAVGVAGYSLTLADGNDWRIPLIRRWDPNTLAHVATLPSAIAGELVNGKHKFVSAVKPQYAALDAKAESIYAGFLDKHTISIDQLMHDASELLALNYRVGVEEVALLGLLTEPLALKLLGLAIDTPGLRACGEAIAQSGLIPRQTPIPHDPVDPPTAEEVSRG